MHTGQEFLPRELARDTPHGVELVGRQTACQDIITLRSYRRISNDAAELRTQNRGRLDVSAAAVQPADDRTVGDVERFRTYYVV